MILEYFFRSIDHNITWKHREKLKKDQTYKYVLFNALFVWNDSMTLHSANKTSKFLLHIATYNIRICHVEYIMLYIFLERTLVSLITTL